MTPNGRWTADEALWDLHMEMRDQLERRDLEDLAALLADMSRDEGELYLRSVRRQTIALLERPADERALFLQTLDRPERLTAIWAAAFWAVKGSLLFEAIGQQHLGEDAIPIAAKHLGLMILDQYEREPFWLWPFDGMSPFYREGSPQPPPANDED